MFAWNLPPSPLSENIIPAGFYPHSVAADFYTMDDFDLSGKRVLLRVDFNSPIDPETGGLLDDSRLKEHLETIRQLDRSKVALMAHQGRPGKDDCTSLEAHAHVLSRLLGKPVRFVDSLFGKPALEGFQSLRSGEILVLENTRFFAEEVALKESEYRTKPHRLHTIRKLAGLADFFVCDAFAAAHRAQPTLTGFPELLPSLAGRLLEREVRMLRRALESTDRPKMAVLGGIKFDDSLSVASHMLKEKIVDKVLTTGGVASVFLLAKGHKLGEKTEAVLGGVTEDLDGEVKRATTILREHAERIETPTDFAVNHQGNRRGIRLQDLPQEDPIADIGLDTVVHYLSLLKPAKTIILNGPAGIFELGEFSYGTEELFRGVAETQAFKVLGGGHTLAAVHKYGLGPRIDHLSTGGGALLEFLSGKPMPAIEALVRSKRKFPRGKSG